MQNFHTKRFFSEWNKNYLKSLNTSVNPEAYLEPCRTSVMEFFWKLLTAFSIFVMGVKIGHMGVGRFDPTQNFVSSAFYVLNADEVRNRK